MFESYALPPTPALRSYGGPLLTAVVLHAAALAATLVLAAREPPEPLEREGAMVAFFQPPPPPPPPPAARRSAATSKPRAKRVTPLARPVLAAPVEPVVEPEPPPSEAAADEAAPEDAVGGTEGGVAGGVAGGTVGGVVGQPLEGAGSVKAKNVPLFVIQRDLLRQTAPRLSEVFKRTHLGGPTVTGAYRVCVGIDGHVYDVQTVKSVPGADEDIARGIREGWQYKAQQVPVCFLYSIPITIR
jgi:protein TonB